MKEKEDRIVSRNKKALDRQVSESVRIELVAAREQECLNLRSE